MDNIGACGIRVPHSGMVLRHFPPYRLIKSYGPFEGGDATSGLRREQIHAYKLYSLPLVMSSHRIFHTPTY